jgi:hypothetical protein
MRPITPTDLIVGGVILLIALWFGLSTFSRPWAYAAWVKLAFRVLAVSAIVHTGLRLLLAYHAFPWTLFWAIYTQQIFFLGVAGGMFFLFIFSGEMLRGYRRWRELKEIRSAPKA